MMTLEVIIYYNPNNPSESYTDKKIDIVTKVFKILGLIFFVIRLVLIALFYNLEKGDEINEKNNI